ncbi:MAG: apolipoprotein N-acyltransferase [Mariprofundaceae bacterium]
MIANRPENRFFVRLRLLAALLCGAAMPFAFSPYDYKWLAIAALTGWILLLNGRAFSQGYAFGLGWFGLGAWWLAPTFHTFGPLAWVWAVLATLAVGAALAVFPALLAWLSWRLANADRTRMLLLLPLLVVGEEWLRGHLFSGLPWTPLGSLLLDTPAIGWAAWIGVYGAALLPVGMAAALAGFFVSGKPVRAAAVLMLLLAAYIGAPSPFTAEGKKHRVALIQASIPQQLKWESGFLDDTVSRYARLSREAAQHSDLIIWPEVAIPLFFEHAPAWRQFLLAQMQTWGKPVLFGGLKLGDDGSSAYNGLYLFQPGATELEFVGKRHLVPFGEYVPSWLPFMHALVPNIADFKPTGDSGVLAQNTARYGSLICYEAIFPEQGRDRAAHASVLVNVTNDAWYGRTPATWQHLQAARMRAVENGRYLLRAANTGVSAIVAPDGAVVNSMPWFEQGVVYGEYRESMRQTPYLRYGDLPLLALLLPLLIIVLYPRRLAI